MLWGLLFIIPGIIAAIRYSQAIFVLLDDPKKPVSQCINESKYLMNGNMGQYVVLHLSFIGWYLLFMFKNNVISALIYAAFGSYVLNSYELSVYLVLGIGLVIIYVFQKPYVTVTCANFYRRLINESMNGIDSEQEPKNQGPWKI